MNKKEWKRKRSLKYIAYNIGYHTFTWDMVTSISDVYININDPKKVKAYYSITLINGKDIKVDLELKTRYIETKKWFGRIEKLTETDAQKYFDTPCKELVNVEESRELTKKAFFKFKRITLKR